MKFVTPVSGASTSVLVEAKLPLSPRSEPLSPVTMRQPPLVTQVWSVATSAGSKASAFGIISIFKARSRSGFSFHSGTIRY